MSMKTLQCSMFTSKKKNLSIIPLTKLLYWRVWMTHEMNDCNNRQIYWWKRFTFAYKLQCMTDVPFQLSRIFAIFLNFLQFFLYAFVMICFSFPSFIQFLCSFFFSLTLVSCTQLHSYIHTHTPTDTQKNDGFSLLRMKCIYLSFSFIHLKIAIYSYIKFRYTFIFLSFVFAVFVCVCMYLQHKKKFNLQILQEIIIMFVNRCDLMVSEWSSNLFMMANIVIFYQAFAKFVDSTFETKNLFIYQNTFTLFLSENYLILLRIWVFYCYFLI